MGSLLTVVVLSSFAAVPRPAIEGAFPAVGTVLPMNARVVVFANVDATYTLEHADGGVEIVAVDERIGIADVLVLPNLTAGEAVALEADGVRFDWVVGDDDDTAAPVFADASTLAVSEVRRGLTGTNGSEAWFIELCLPALVDEEPILARVGGDVLDDVLVEVAGDCGDGGHVVNVRVPGDTDGEACFDVVAVDVAGNAGAPATVCATLNALLTPSCAQGATAPFAVGALLLAFRRRRR